METGLLACVKRKLCKSPPEQGHRPLLLPGRNCLSFTCLCKTCKIGLGSKTTQITINLDLVYKQVSSPFPSFLSFISLPSLLSLLCSQVHTARPPSCCQPASVSTILPCFFLHKYTLFMTFVSFPAYCVYSLWKLKRKDLRSQDLI